LNFLGIFKDQHIGKEKENKIFHIGPRKELNSRRLVPLPWPAGASSVLAPIRRGKGSEGKGKRMGSERAPRHTRLRAWPDLGRSGRGSPAVAVLAAVWWRREPSYGEGEAQGGGGIASGDPGAATYSEEKGEERRMAGRHGDGITAERAAALCAWQLGSRRGNRGIGSGKG
jgi:hypothetical protein